MREQNKKPKCNNKHECFGNNNGYCHILRETYDKDTECPFCKKRIEDKTEIKT